MSSSRRKRPEDYTTVVRCEIRKNSQRASHGLAPKFSRSNLASFYKVFLDDIFRSTIYVSTSALYQTRNGYPDANLS